MVAWSEEWGPWAGAFAPRWRTSIKRRLVRAAAVGRSAGDPKDGVAILAYHATPAGEKHPMWLDFPGQMALLADLGYEVVSLSEAIARIRDGRGATRPTAAITFDDGWASNLDVAFRELSRRGWPGTLFLTTSFIGRRPFLSEAEVRTLPSLGIDVEPHTHAHPDMTTIADAEILADLAECRARIEDLTGRRGRYFCYPFGRVDGRVRGVVAGTGLEGACCGAAGRNLAGADPFLLRRATPDAGDGRRDLRAILAGGLVRIHAFRSFLGGR